MDNSRGWLGLARRWTRGGVQSLGEVWRVILVGEEESDGSAANFMEALVSAPGLAAGLWAKDVDVWIFGAGARAIAAAGFLTAAIVPAIPPETTIIDAETLRRLIPGDQDEAVLAIERPPLAALDGHGVVIGDASGTSGIFTQFQTPVLLPTGHVFFLSAGVPADQMIGRWLYREAS